MIKNFGLGAIPKTLTWRKRYGDIFLMLTLAPGQHIDSIRTHDDIQRHTPKDFDGFIEDQGLIVREYKAGVCVWPETDQ
jgi:hypothetical protein